MGLRDLFELGGKVALITGGATGIGLATARQLLATHPGASLLLLEKESETKTGLGERRPEGKCRATLRLRFVRFPCLLKHHAQGLEVILHCFSMEKKSGPSVHQ